MVLCWFYLLPQINLPQLIVIIILILDTRTHSAQRERVRGRKESGWKMRNLIVDIYYLFLQVLSRSLRAIVHIYRAKPTTLRTDGLYRQANNAFVHSGGWWRFLDIFFALIFVLLVILLLAPVLSQPQPRQRVGVLIYGWIMRVKCSVESRASNEG